MLAWQACMGLHRALQARPRGVASQQQACRAHLHCARQPRTARCSRGSSGTRRAERRCRARAPAQTAGRGGGRGGRQSPAWSHARACAMLPVRKVHMHDRAGVACSPTGMAGTMCRRARPIPARPLPAAAGRAACSRARCAPSRRRRRPSTGRCAARSAVSRQAREGTLMQRRAGHEAAGRETALPCRPGSSRGCMCRQAESQRAHSTRHAWGASPPPAALRPSCQFMQRPLPASLVSTDKPAPQSPTW